MPPKSILEKMEYQITILPKYMRREEENKGKRQKKICKFYHWLGKYKFTIKYKKCTQIHCKIIIAAHKFVIKKKKSCE